MKKKILTLLLIVISSISILGCSNTEVNEESGNDKGTYKIKHGELLEENVNDDVLVIKAKIEPSMNNKLTISQNGFNIEDIIKNQGGDKFKEIQYWAVADMSNGEESKVVSFTLNENLINNIKDGKIVANQIIDNAQDVYILPSLQN